VNPAGPLRRAADRRDLLPLVKELAREQSRLRLGLSAAGAAFWLAIATLPLLVAVVSLYGLVRTRAQVTGDLAALFRAGPGTLSSVVAQQLRTISNTGRGTLSIGLVVSLVVALWSASTSIYNLDRAITSAYGFAPIHYVQARVRALLGAVATVVIIGVVAALAAWIESSLDRISRAVEVLVGVPALLLFLVGTLWWVYRFAVHLHRAGRRFLVGAVSAAVALLVLVVGFNVYVRLAGQSKAIYGALGGVVLAMLFAYLATYIILLGALLNATLDGRRAAELGLGDGDEADAGH
jgi:membrane protein